MDPAGLYGGDPDYEDWANSPAGLRKLNVGFVYENYLFSEYKSLGMIPIGFTPAGADSRDFCRFRTYGWRLLTT